MERQPIFSSPEDIKKQLGTWAEENESLDTNLGRSETKKPSRAIWFALMAATTAVAAVSMAPKAIDAAAGFRHNIEIERADDAKLKDARIEAVEREFQNSLESQGYSAEDIVEAMNSPQYREAVKMMAEEEPEDFVDWIQKKLNSSE